MLRNIHVIIIFFAFCFFNACSHPKEGIEAVLAQAGRNRKELEKVIAYYQNTGDSLKLKAALFLIENMDWGHSYTGKEVEKYDSLFTEICNMKTGRGMEAVFNEYHEKYGELTIEKLNQLDDVRSVSAHFLIENIELAFEAWRRYPWAKEIGFELFCQSVLPYRISNEPLENWRPLFINHYKWLKDTLKNETDVRRVFGAINYYIAKDFHVSDRWRYPFLPKFSHIIDCKASSCDVMASLMVAAMRSQGVPAYKDFVIKWGNKEYGHAWAVVLDKNGVNYWCFGEEDTLARNDVFAPSSRIRLDTLGVKYLPPGFVVDTVKTVPKIYRTLFHKNPDQSMLLKDEFATEILPFFRNPNLQDVTSMYLKDCKDVTVQLRDLPRKTHFAYLAIFNKKSWQPVAVAKIHNNKATFKAMGQDILYLPVAMVYDKRIPIGDPFLLKNGQQQTIIIDAKNKKSVTLFRKDRLFANTVINFNQMVRGRFEGANLPDFGDAQLLHLIQKAPIYMDSVTLKSSKPYRYVRYKAANDRPGSADIAELEFYNNYEKLNGNIIGISGGKANEAIKAMDENWDTYYKAIEKKNAWIGLDLGTAQSITKIRFCPRNDTDVIIPGNKYMLYYWSNEWIQVAIKTADAMSITFDNIPTGALLWLRCLNGGKEESPFIIQNGVQVFL